MKKLPIMTLIALAAVTSCIKDEVKEVNRGTEIGFRTAVQTKGMENDSWTLETIYVTALEEDGTPYFSKAAFAKTGNSSDGYFNTSPAYYWPGDGRSFDFYAYSPSEAELGGTVEISGTAKKLTGFTTEENIWDQVDFITAKAADQTEENNTGSIGLIFNHHLTRVDVYASTSSDLYEYIVNGVRIANVWSSGDFDLESEEWDLTDYTNAEYLKTFEMELTEPATLHRYNNISLMGKLDYKNGTENNSAFLIPQTITSWDPENPAAGGSYISVNIQINKKHDDGSVTRIYPATGSDYGWVAVPLPENTVWNAGDYYRYYLNFGSGAGYVDPSEDPTGETILGEAIKMTMSVNEWVSSEENTLKNIEMIGRWTATRYYELIEEDELQEDGTYLTVTTIEDDTEDKTVIAGYIDNFAEITIKDGTKLITEYNDVMTETPYILDEDNNILIEIYQSKDAEGNPIEGQYNVYPQIANISPATADPYQKGSAEIHVLQSNRGTEGTGDYYKRTQIILYDIEPLSVN